jgi:hypothetical protein
MNPTTVAAAADSLASLPPAGHDFLIQLGLVVIALTALAVAFKALSRRGRW